MDAGPQRDRRLRAEGFGSGALVIGGVGCALAALGWSLAAAIWCGFWAVLGLLGSPRRRQV